MYVKAFHLLYTFKINLKFIKNTCYLISLLRFTLFMALENLHLMFLYVALCITPDRRRQASLQFLSRNEILSLNPESLSASDRTGADVFVAAQLSGTSYVCC